MPNIMDIDTGFPHHKLKGLERKAHVQKWNEEEGESVLIAAGAAEFNQDLPYPMAKAVAVQAWNDAIWGGIIDC